VEGWAQPKGRWFTPPQPTFSMGCRFSAENIGYTLGTRHRVPTTVPFFIRLPLRSNHSRATARRPSHSLPASAR